MVFYMVLNGPNRGLGLGGVPDGGACQSCDLQVLEAEMQTPKRFPILQHFRKGSASGERGRGFPKLGVL